MPSETEQSEKAIKPAELTCSLETKPVNDGFLISPKDLGVGLFAWVQAVPIYRFGRQILGNSTTRRNTLLEGLERLISLSVSRCENFTEKSPP